VLYENGVTDSLCTVPFSRSECQACSSFDLSTT
jgi:hypothetical protein